MNKYYYIVIDKSLKTLQLMQSSDCVAVVKEELGKKHNLKYSCDISARFKLLSNGTSNIIDINNVYKYARSYKQIT